MNLNIFKKNRLMKIRIYGDDVLKRKAEPFKDIDSDTMELAQAILETMKSSDGVGLAAPQVGVSRQIILLDVPMPDPGNPVPMSPGELFLLPKMPLVLINPELTNFSDDTVMGEEGCLSIPKIYANVRRHKSLTLIARMITGENIELECSGFLARVLQHEVDHLNGILFVDRLDKSEYMNIKYDLKKLQKKSKKLRPVRKR
jgi:peptide deformylase